MRLTSKLWISALFKQVSAKGGYSTVLHAGDAQAGAIFVIERNRGTIACWAPIPQMMFMNHDDNEDGDNRMFECLKVDCDEEYVSKFITRQLDFDRDCHIIELDGCAADLPVPKENRKDKIRDDIDEQFGNVFKK